MPVCVRAGLSGVVTIVWNVSVIQIVPRERHATRKRMCVLMTILAIRQDSVAVKHRCWEINHLRDLNAILVIMQGM